LHLVFGTHWVGARLRHHSDPVVVVCPGATGAYI
jgi:hypothetical protein